MIFNNANGRPKNKVLTCPLMIAKNAVSPFLMLFIEHSKITKEIFIKTPKTKKDYIKILIPKAILKNIIISIKRRTPNFIQIKDE